MDGNNKYEAEGFGKQDAKKGIKFLSFPNVLMIQLKRFEFDHQKNQMCKIYDRFEYYDKLDLNKYIANSDNNLTQSTNELFTLHSVVVHSGNAFSGHYYAYIRPHYNDNQWYLFNDEYVKPAKEHEVFKNQFGGVTKNWVSRYGGVFEQHYLCDASAYVLVYIKDSEREKILTKVNEIDVIINFY